MGKTSRAPIHKPFIGRRIEMESLRGALREAAVGHGRIVMMTGEPGVGKTRTAEEVCEAAGLLHVEAAWGRCFEMEGAPLCRPWSLAVADLLRLRRPTAIRHYMDRGAPVIAGMLSAVAEAFPGLPAERQPDNPASARFRFFDAMAAFFRRAAADRSILVILDDLHWADSVSLQLLSFLSHDVAGTRLLLLGTYRDAELHGNPPLRTMLGELAGQPVFESIALKGFDAGEVADFLSATCEAGVTAGLADAVLARTEGNPFLVTEVGRHLSAGTPDTAGWKLGLPAGVQEVFGRRLDRLSPPCREVLQAAAGIGREFDLRVVGKIVEGGSADDLLRLADEASARGLIEEMPDNPGRYRFDHVLTAQSLLADLSPGDRARVHARIAIALEAFYGEKTRDHAQELAGHFGQAKMVLGQAKALQYLRTAGEQALASYAYEEARRCFDRALALQEDSPPDEQTADLLFGLGRAQIALGDDAADSSIGRAFDLHLEAGRTSRAVAVAIHPIWRSEGMRPATMERMYRQALPFVRKDSAEHAELLLKSAQRSMGMPSEESSLLLARALRIARREAKAGLEIRILSALVYLDSELTDFRAVAKHAALAHELAVKEGDLETQCAALRVMCSRALVLPVMMEEGLRITEEFRVAAERLRDRRYLSVAYFECNRWAWIMADWPRARAWNDACLSIAGDKFMPILAHRAIIEYETGHLDEADRAIGRSVEIARPLPASHTYRAGVATYITQLALISCRSLWLETAERFAKDAASDPCTTSNGKARAMAALGNLAVLHADAEAASKSYAILSSNGSLVPAFWPHEDRALLARTAGRIDDAVRILREACAWAEKNGQRRGLQWGLFYLAETFIQRSAPGDREEAEGLLVKLLPMAAETGSVLVAGRAEKLLERLQCRLPLPGKEKRPDGLTPREIEVLRLIVTGRTNKGIGKALFVSEATVSTHLRSILAKTGSANRAEAAAYAVRNGLAGP